VNLLLFNIWFSEPKIKEIDMATELRRFMVSITPELETALDRFKQRLFYNKTQSEMVRAVLKLGIQALEAKDQKEVKR
jgi:metal-responsive CopG/Arc/MetJ family transcriptional regulator